MGRVAVVAVVGAAVLGGALLYYIQVFGFYEDVEPAGLTAGGAPVEARGFEGIARGSSPISYRACFAVADPAALTAAPYPAAVPQVAPFWFDCFDARAIGADIAAGRAAPVMLEPEVAVGVDRVAAVYEDGRVYAWQQINETIAPNRRID